jgi:hypothetical protein
VKGRRPNRASWYAVSWFALDSHRDYDEGAAALFKRGAYRLDRTPQNASLNPRRGVSTPGIDPARGIIVGAVAPQAGAVLH